MTWDTGFAPNPYHGVLTLATCKPRIRKFAQVGDWITGWTAKTTRNKERKPVKYEDGARLIYLARITDKMTIAEYWEKYPQKRPNPIGGECGYDTGDNIYKPCVKDPSGEADYEQQPNCDHTQEDRKRDISGEYVLICEEFYYWGVENALEVPKDIVPFAIPRWKKVSCEECKLVEFALNQDRNKMFKHS